VHRSKIFSYWTYPVCLERFSLFDCHFSLEVGMRFISQRRMASFWIVEAIDVFSKLTCCLMSCLECCSPDEFVLDGFEHRFHH